MTKAPAPCATAPQANDELMLMLVKGNRRNKTTDDKTARRQYNC